MFYITVICNSFGFADNSNIISTCDFTHPGWFKELQEKLKPDGNEFFKLKNASQNYTKSKNAAFLIHFWISFVLKRDYNQKLNRQIIILLILFFILLLIHYEKFTF